jgi:hypothetical protein
MSQEISSRNHDAGCESIDYHCLRQNHDPFCDSPTLVLASLRDQPEVLFPPHHPTPVMSSPEPMVSTLLFVLLSIRVTSRC